MALNSGAGEFALPSARHRPLHHCYRGNGGAGVSQEALSSVVGPQGANDFRRAWLSPKDAETQSWADARFLYADPVTHVEQRLHRRTSDP